MLFKIALLNEKAFHFFRFFHRAVTAFENYFIARAAMHGIDARGVIVYHAEKFRFEVGRDENFFVEFAQKPFFDDVHAVDDIARVYMAADAY